MKYYVVYKRENYLDFNIASHYKKGKIYSLKWSSRANMPKLLSLKEARCIIHYLNTNYCRYKNFYFIETEHSQYVKRYIKDYFNYASI